VSAFAIDPATGLLKLLNTVRSGGAGPTHASLHPSGRFLFVANYFGGSVAVFPVKTNGNLAEASDVQKDEGEIGPRISQNAPPGSFAFSGHDLTHAHMIQPDPTGRFVLHTDLGLDRVYSWRFSEQSGRLQPNDPPFVALPPGDGPRHFTFHPSGRWMYAIQEEGSTVATFEWDSERGRLSKLQTVSSLPAGYAGSNFCSGIQVSPDGRYVYAGNRLHDSLGIFRVCEAGTLEWVGEEWTRGNYPRSFQFDPSGRFLYVCNQRADHVAVFTVDKERGRLSFTGQYVPVGNPSAVVFVDLRSR
jgi:6-phosphogluconolactonase (cycloisomerase 2 family)